MTEIVIALRRLTVKTLNKMRRDTDTADFREHLGEFVFSANEVARALDMPPKKALKELAKLHDSGDVLLRGTGTIIPGKAMWQLGNIRDVVENFYIKFS